MPPPDFNNAAHLAIAPSLHQPAIVGWNRLEPRPRTTNFLRSLKAEIHDPLWMLTRQWQTGEFKGEDAGSPIFARVNLETTQINRYAEKNKPAVAYNRNVPMEVTVEKEEVPIDLLTRIQMGHYWFRLLDAKQLSQSYRPLYRRKFPPPTYSSITSHPQEFSNRKAWQLRVAAFRRAMDGYNFYIALKSGDKAEDMTIDDLVVADGDKDKVKEASDEFKSWYNRRYTQPENPKENAWSPEHLEYQCACSVPEPNNEQTVMIADEYYRGCLDWYSFDIDPSQEKLNDKPGEVIDDAVIKDETFTFLPNPIRFAGMPNERWWEIEDSRTGFVGVDVSTTDIAKLMLMEFGLIYSNDWHYVPYSVPMGSLCEVKGLEITDCFGQRTLIKPAGQCDNEDWQKWNMFNLSHRNDPTMIDHRLFLPPTIGKLMEGKPIEKVNFIRDEMANMVWGIESTIPDNLGSGMDGYESAIELINLLKLHVASEESSPTETEAKISYQIANTPPENWIPFISIHVSGSNRETQLQRAQILRAVEGLPNIPILPRGNILRPDHRPDLKYYIHEEEIPRAGAIVTRSYQRTRWTDGSTHVSIGRRKQIGRGEGSSGLKFDQIEPLETKE